MQPSPHGVGGADERVERDRPIFGIKADTVAFDIWSDGAGKNEAWLMADGTLYSVDLATGKATSVGKIAGVTGAVRKITMLPKM